MSGKFRLTMQPLRMNFHQVEGQEIYVREVWLQGRDGKRVIIASEKRETPFEAHKIGAQFAVNGAKPKSYTVIGNFIRPSDCERPHPRKQMLIVEENGLDELTGPRSV